MFLGQSSNSMCLARSSRARVDQTYSFVDLHKVPRISVAQLRECIGVWAERTHETCFEAG